MKYLKYVLGILALLILVFIALGFLIPTISYNSEIIVDKSIEESWAVMNDESKTNQWLKGITKTEHIGGEKGAIGAMTKYTFNDNGEESIIVETIKSIRSNEYIAMDFEMENVMNMAYEIEFLESDGKTKIKSSTVTKGTGILMRSMMSFMKNSMKAQEDENLNNLRTLINENTTNYFPVPVLETEAQNQG